MSDRHNLPSCSGLERIHLCPGSWLAERGLPERKNDDAESGTKIHDVLAGKALPSTLTLDERSTVDRCEMYLRQAVHAALGVAIEDCDIVNRQPERMWLQLGGERVLSGECDVIALPRLTGDEALIVDFKTGWGDTEVAPRNLQLRGYAVLLREKYPTLKRIVVAIIAPHQDEPLTMAQYEVAHLLQAKAEILRDLEAAHAIPTRSVSMSGKAEAEMALPPERKPSLKACQYCKALAHCPEARGLALGLPDGTQTTNVYNEKLTIKQIAARLTPEQLGECLERIRLFEPFSAEVKAVAKYRLKAGEEVPGYRLAPGRKSSVITNAPQVHQRALERGVTTAGFLSCITVRKGALEELVAEATGTKGKALRETMAGILDGCTEEKVSEEILEKV